MANAERERLRAGHTDLAGYLKSLEMVLRWQPFDSIGLQRIVQLINKTNQFNLTTRRYTEAEVTAVMNAPGTVTLQIRLLDTFGDNGIIGIVIGLPEGDAMRFDTWLMSCRVLGRQVEEATMNLIVELARERGVGRLIGEYVPTKKNGMVKDHYQKLGFKSADRTSADSTFWELSVAEYRPFDTSISIVKGA
jgi:FkbH-like protein